MSVNNLTLASVWRYPVKSMMGEELNAAEVSEKGIVGDRAYALVDIESNKVVSAKNPKKWPEMFYFYARYNETPTTNQKQTSVAITLPNGDTLNSDQADADQVLSTAFSRPVKLTTQAPTKATLEQYWPEYEGENTEISEEAISGDAHEGSFFDYATLHILTTATVLELQKLCPRCVMPSLAQGDLAKDAKILKTIAQNTVHVPFADKALPSAGIYAKVIQPGVIKRNDVVIVE